MFFNLPYRVRKVKAPSLGADQLAIFKVTEDPKMPPKIHPDTVTLNILKTVLLEDQKLIAGNPIVKQVIDRYVDIVKNTDDEGYNKAAIEPTVSFRNWINDLTVGHLERIRKKREKLKYRQSRKTTEKKVKQEGRAKFNKTQRKSHNVH